MKKIALSLLAILLLVGCGKTTPKQEKETVKLVLDWTPNTNHTGLYVALENGYFEDVNLEIVQPPEDGAVGLVASKGAEFGVSFQDSLVPVFTKDEPLPVTAVAAMIQHNTSGLVSLKEKGIDRPAKLEGHTYATWDMDIEKAIVAKVIEDDGGNFSKVNLVPSTVTDIVSALKTQVDAVWIFDAWDGAKLRSEKTEINYFNFADYGKELDYYTPVLIANNDYLQAHPEQAKSVLSAIRKGYEFAIENPKEAADILMKHVPELQSSEAMIYESQNFLADKYQAEASQWGIFDAERWNAFHDWLYEIKIIEKPIDKGFGFSNDFIEK
ncbi:ABC transporter substrate-binding protein [Erysipelothrix urinaevulpis]|uniref:ABC transporter substrate-binding protein n=1 Tax=Erysipelothrix urinaevulpis TaxID=2683717 RepID=UPI00135A7A5A|nr:ABC transporter substrate-binding protein [Erysipelothrix urinaevulpis]